MAAASASPPGRPFVAIHVIYPTFDNPDQKSTFTGHTFVSVGDGHGAVTRWGYYPAFYVLGRDAVPPCDHIDGVFDAFKPVRGLLVNETHLYRPVDETMAFALDDRQYQQIVRRIKSWHRNPPDYTLFGLNCVSFAIDVLQTAKMPVPPQLWDIDTPLGIGIGIRLEKWRQQTGFVGVCCKRENR